MLSHAGLVNSSAGVAGATLARPARKITLLDVYRAVDMEDEHRLAVHGEPDQCCVIGRHIQGALDAVIGPAEEAFEAKLGAPHARGCQQLHRRPGEIVGRDQQVPVSRYRHSKEDDL